MKRKLGSSRVTDEPVAPGLEEEEDGSAKSEDEVGRGVRDDALGILKLGCSDWK